MGKNKDKGRLYCVICIFAIFGSYALQRIISLSVEPSRALALVQAILFTAALAVIYFLVIKSKEVYYGIITAIMGTRMMPPTISSLEQFSPAGEILYYIVGKFAFLLFILAIVKLYRQQEKPEQIKALPIATLIFVIPFAKEIVSQLSTYALKYISSSMIYPYFISFAIYSMALLFFLIYASNSTKQNALMIIDVNLVALVVNIARRVCVVIAYTLQNNHISKSYYVWIAIYTFFAVAFSILKKKKKTA